ncbi:MAG: RusA family crossover junction endodeoxyribonuclease [Lewinellaceae bacterium]|nr:RusA family crossover junction endodeoxyribonuclease [Saprospiraceae bacterium]MCB9341147.1 RusA family crossover junction endodeoxyribonuclease [Lewinellaceae bacterium]
MKVVLKSDPDLDFFIGFLGGEEIPTKQDWFVQMVGYKFTKVEEDGTETEMDDFDFYFKRKTGNNLKKFSDTFKAQIQENLKTGHPYKKPEKLEVIISVSMDEERLENVDVDNLAKTILDCFKGLVFEDDSQVVSLIVSKDINGFYPINGLLVGIRRLSNKQSWTGGMKLAYLEELKE